MTKNLYTYGEYVIGGNDMLHKILKYLQTTLLAVLLAISPLSVLHVAALDEIKDDTDLSKLQLYQFSLR